MNQHAHGEARRVEKGTLQQIAELAGVSTATVSRVLNPGRAGSAVSQETRQRVLEAAQGYTPRSRSRSATIGVIVPTLRHPIYAELAQYLIIRLREAGLMAVLTVLREPEIADRDEAAADSREEECIRVLIDRGVAGIIAVPAGPPATGSKWALVEERNTPVVFVDRAGGGQAPRMDVVGFADREEAKDATLFLLERQHTQIGVLSGPKTNPSFKARIAGIQEAFRDFRDLRDERLSMLDNAYLTHCSLDETDEGQKDRESQAKRLLTLEPQPTAIFTFDPLLCEAVLAGIIDLKMKVPSNISLVTYGSVPRVWAHTLGCELNTVVRSMDHLAMRAVRQLLFRLQHTKEEDTKAEQYEIIVLRPVTDDSLRRGGSVEDRRPQDTMHEDLTRQYKELMRQFGQDSSQEASVSSKVGEAQATGLLELGRIGVNLARYDTIPYLMPISQHGQELSQWLPENLESLLETASLSPLGVATWLQGNPEKAEEHFRRGLEVARRNGSIDLTREFLMRLGKLKGNQGEYEQAQAYLQEGLDLAHGEDVAGVRCEFLMHLGWVAGNQGNYGDADELLNAGLIEANRPSASEDTDKLRSGILMNLGWIAHSTGELDPAEEKLRDGLQYAEHIRHEERSRIVHSCGLRENLSTVARYRGNWPTAQSLVSEDLLLEVVEDPDHPPRVRGLLKGLDHPPRLCGLLESQAWILIHNHAFDKAHDLLEQGLDLAIRIRYPVRVCGLLQASGCLDLLEARNCQIVSVKEQLLQKASDEVMAAYLLAKRSGHRFLTSSANICIGELHLARCEWGQATNRFRQAHNLACKGKQQLILAGWAKYGLARAYAELGDASRALANGTVSETTLRDIKGLKHFGFHQVDEVTEWRQNFERLSASSVQR